MRNSGYDFACEYTMDLLTHSQINKPAVPVSKICRRFELDVVVERIWPRRAMLDRRRHRIILHPADESVQTWLLAHELGHVLLPEHYTEVSFDTFANCLLMPHEWLAKDIRHYTTQELARIYGVSLSIMKQRIRLFRNATQIEFNWNGV